MFKGTTILYFKAVLLNSSNIALFILSTEGMKFFDSSLKFSFTCFVLLFGLGEGVVLLFSILYKNPKVPEDFAVRFCSSLLSF